MPQDTFKLKDIIGLARLNPSTAKYVLRNPEILTGMPPGGTQGAHRVFNVKQAYRFAACAHINQAGVPLRTAVKLLDLCFAAERRHSAGHGSHLPFRGEWTARWTLLVADSAFAQLRVGKEVVKLCEADWYSIVSEGATSYREGRAFVTTVIDFTQIAHFMDM